MKDATIEIIKDIIKHPNADLLQICVVLGFKTITKLDEFKIGQKVIYVKPDSVFSINEWSEPYRTRAKHRIKSVRIRDEWSDGVIIPFDKLPIEIFDQIKDKNIGDDVSNELDIFHYEEPKTQEPDSIGALPNGLSETDEKLYQSIMEKIPFGEKCDVDLKYDGKSASYMYNYTTKKFRIFGRRLEFALDAKNNYRYMVDKYDIEKKLTKYCEDNKMSLVIRGELYGTGVQNNKHNVHIKNEVSWAMFSTYLFDEKRTTKKGSPFYFRNVAPVMDLPMVDMIEEDVILTEELLKKYSEDLKTVNGKRFEGVVIKHSKGSFKVINKSYDSHK